MQKIPENKDTTNRNYECVCVFSFEIDNNDRILFVTLIDFEAQEIALS